MRIRSIFRATNSFMLLLTWILILSLCWAYWETSTAKRNETIVAEMSQIAYERVVLRDEYLLRHEERARLQWVAKTNQFKQLLTQVDSRFTKPPEDQVLQNIQRNFEANSNRFTELLALYVTEKAIPGQFASFGEKRMLSQIIGTAYDLHNDIVKLGTLTRRTTEKIQHIIAVLSLLLGTITVLVILGNSVVINRLVSRRLHSLCQGMEIIGAGNLDHRMAVTGKDEFTNLSLATNAMAAKLQESYTSVVDLQKVIAEREQVEAERAKSERLFRLLFENMAANFMLVELVSDAQGHPIDYRFLALNPAFEKNTGIVASSLIGKTNYACFPGTEQYWFDSFVQVVQTKQPKMFEYYSAEMNKHYNATIYHVEGNQVAGIFTDITERKEAEKQLLQHRNTLENEVQQRTLDLEDTQSALLNMLEDMNMAQQELETANERLKEVDRLKSMFIASMSHELRTPLNSVIGFSSILLNEWIGTLNDEQKKSQTSILNSGKHLLALINDVIDVSKIEASMIEVHCDDFDLADLLAEVAQTLSAVAEKQSLTLVVQESHLPMHTDRRRLFQCVLNLVGNGLKYTEQGEVTLTTRQTGDQLEIAVTDTGIGISVEDQSKLFMAFSRIPSHLSAKVLGTGLGLYLTKKILVEVLQGEVSVTSTPGMGSTFTMRLPTQIDDPLQVKTDAERMDA